MPASYLRSKTPDLSAKLNALEKLDDYRRVMVATDFVSGMTDTYAVDMFQKLSGIELPE